MTQQKTPEERIEKHKIMCSCGKLAIQCEKASKAIEDLILLRIEETIGNYKKEIQQLQIQLNASRLERKQLVERLQIGKNEI